MSQPALSRSISRIETLLGVQLFTRSSRGVVATALGERFLNRGGLLLEDAAGLEREIKLMQGLEVEVLRVSAGPYPAEIAVAPALGRLTSRYPQLRIEYSTCNWREIIGKLLQAQLDIAVVELSVVNQEPRLLAEALPRHRGVFYCRAEHPLLQQATPDIEQIFSYPFAGTALPARVGQMFYRLARTGAIDPDTGDYLPPIRVDTVSLAKAIVLASDAIGMAPHALIVPELTAGKLAALPFDEPWLHTNYGFVYLKDRPLSPAQHAFMAEIRTVEQQLAETKRCVSIRVA